MKTGLRHVQSFTGAYAFLSNPFPAWVEYEGMYFPTVEHAFQAAKTLDREARKRFCGGFDAGTARSMGERLEPREDWETVKLSVMEELLRDKFTRHTVDDAPTGRRDLRGALLATGTAVLENGSCGDPFWGTAHGRGENHLGKLLMALRDQLRAADAKREELVEGWDRLLEDLRCEEASTTADFMALFRETWEYLHSRIGDTCIPCGEVALIRRVAAFTALDHYPAGFRNWEFDAALRFAEGLLDALADTGPHTLFRCGCILVEESMREYEEVRIENFEREFTAMARRFWEDGYADEEDYDDSDGDA